MSNIYLIDDNLVHLTYMKKRVLNYIEKKNLDYAVNEVVNIGDFYSKISTYNILDTDTFFIDIQLRQYFNGIDLAEKIRNINLNCLIIFITGETDKSLEIIKRSISPFGYIVKRANDIETQIDEMLDKVIHVISDQKDIFIFKNFKRDLLFIAKEINYFCTIKGNRYQIYLQTYNGDYVINESFANVKKRAFPEYYIIFKSYIINSYQIRLIDHKNGKIVFKNNKELYLSSLMLNKLLKKIH